MFKVNFMAIFKAIAFKSSGQMVKMWPDSSVLIVMYAFIFLVHSLPLNIDWNTLHHNPDPIVQNERILNLYLQLATHTAIRLTYLRKEIKRYDCNKHNDNSSVSTEIPVTQLPSQENPEWFDESQKVLIHSSSNDSDVNADQNQTTLQIQQLSDLNNLQDIKNQNVTYDPMMSDLIPKSIQNVQDTLSDIAGHNREAFNSDSLQKSILNLDAANKSQSAGEIELDSSKSARNDVNKELFNQIDLIKNVTNNTSMNNSTVNKLLPNSQDLQEPTLEISPRLFGADLAQIVPKIINDAHEDAKQYLSPQNTRELLDKIDDVGQKFSNTIKTPGNVLNSLIANNLSAANQVLSSAKNVESMIKVLPEAAKGAANLLNQIIPKSREIINTPLKVAEEGQQFFTRHDYTQQEQNKNLKQTENQSDNQLHDRQDLTGGSGDNIRETDASERDNQEIKISNLTDNNRQDVSTSLSDSFVPLARSFPDFNGEKTNEKIKTDLSSVQTNENSYNFTENQSLNHETDQLLDQIDGEIQIEEFKNINGTETDYDDGQLNPILEDLSQRSTESGSTNVATSTSPILLESSTLVSITERQANNSSDAQDFENPGDITKINTEETRRLVNIPSNDEINQSTGSKITHDDEILKLNGRSLIDDLTGISIYSHEQLSESKLQEISDRLINALRPYIEERMDNNSTNEYSKV
ncbi:uncharacterized protein DDB_G0281497-like [Monomorium pharaonis]|uniref:uncharacterized protein DDB_G0281497-like n=1 Tax=Monomorium pharaonis TaxID=307658 RepID=UPI001747AA02|nr:uncharacterized protein DDB_G0281497-like [Monomorium pharaonis]